MRSNAFRAIDHIGQLNSIKSRFVKEGRSFSGEELRQTFQECGLPNNLNFWTEFQRALLIRISAGYFVWKDDNPIYYKMLENIYALYKRKKDVYVKRYLIKRKGIPSKKEKIESAVKFLKDLGFEIYAPYKRGLYKKL